MEIRPKFLQLIKNGEKQYALFVILIRLCRFLLLSNFLSVQENTLKLRFGQELFSILISFLDLEFPILTVNSNYFINFRKSHSYFPAQVLEAEPRATGADTLHNRGCLHLRIPFESISASLADSGCTSDRLQCDYINDKKVPIRLSGLRYSRPLYRDNPF